MSKKTARKKRQQGRRSFLPLMLGGVSVLIIAGIVFLSRQPDVEQTRVPLTVAGSPNLEIDQEHIDFGDVPVNKMVRASFKLSNSGDEPLLISYSPLAQVVEGC